MPTYRFHCESCRHSEDLLVSIDKCNLRQVCSQCGDLSMLRQFSPTRVLRMASWMSNEAYDSRARHRQYLERPDVREQIRKGILDVESADDRVYAETGEGPSIDDTVPEVDLDLDTMTEEMMARGWKTAAEQGVASA
jgi:putative FmdB family regulatory protein